MPLVKVPKFMKSIKYMLGSVNSLFLLTGLLLILVGVVVRIKYSEYESLITKSFFSLPNFVISTGALILLVSGLGYFAAFTEHFIAIAVYIIFLAVFLVFEISIVVVGYNLYNDSVTEIRPTMAQSIQYYESRLEIASIWDNLQMDFECCGVVGRGDWGINRIPVSCCHVDYGTISPFECNTTNAYSTGCATALGSWLSYNALVVAVSASVVAGLQLLILSASGYVGWKSRFEEIEF